MRSIQQGLKDEGFAVPMTKLCRWFGVARRTTYYKPTRAPAKVNAELAEPIKEMIEAEPSFGYRRRYGPDKLLGPYRHPKQTYVADGVTARMTGHARQCVKRGTTEADNNACAEQLTTKAER